MSPNKSNLVVFAETLTQLAKNDHDLIVMTGDSRGSGKLTNFVEQFPKQNVEVGIAEQNLIGIASGLAHSGKKVFAVSPASFITARSLEQIKNDLAYSNVPVKIVGISAGVSYGTLGYTHHALHDFAVLLAINNIDIVAPADNIETRKTIIAAATYPHPLYIRFGKFPMQNIHDVDIEFKIGKSISIKTGSDGTFIAIGETVILALRAALRLEKKGLSFGVISMHSLRPFDQEAVLNAAKTTNAIITVEEHSINGGLGSLCACLLMQANIHCAMKIVGIPDEYIVNGTQYEILNYYGISPEGLVKTAQELIKCKTS